MKEQFCTYEISKSLKELGFDAECLAIYYCDDNPKELLFSIPEKRSSNPEVAKYQARDAIRQINFDKGWAIKVPLWQQAIDWLREKKGINISIHYWTYYTCRTFNHDKYESLVFYKSAKGADWSEYYRDYNKAREQAILKAIELCKNN